MSQLTATMEQKLILSLMDRCTYEQVSASIDTSLFGPSHRMILNALQETYATIPDLSTVSCEELKTQLFLQQSPTRATRQQLNSVFDSMEMETPCSTEMLLDVLNKLHTKSLALQIATEAAGVLSGQKAGLSHIVSLLEQSTALTTLHYDEVSTSLDDLLLQESPESRFKLPLAPLQDRIQGMGRGNLAIIFGRPEVGKSSFVTSMIVGFLQQRLKVAYFANEEPGFKIMLNMIRCATNRTDVELRTDHEAGVNDYEEWDDIKNYLKLHEAVGVSLSDIAAYADANEPDVIVVDQTDKLHIAGQFEAGHARLKELYVGTREIAKRNNCLFINVSQASADAEGKRSLNYDMLDGSKTGKAGEGDVIIGVGKNPGPDEDFLRYLTVSKNKISGWHGMVTCNFDPSRNQWSG